jgi:hypothetical protein
VSIRGRNLLEHLDRARETKQAIPQFGTFLIQYEQLLFASLEAFTEIT